MNMVEKRERRFLEPRPEHAQDAKTAVEDSLRQNEKALRRLAEL